MPSLTAIVPTRGRPQAARELITTFQATCEADTHLMFAVDISDHHLREYLDLLEDYNPDLVSVFAAPSPSNMVRALNAAARHAITHGGPFAVAFMGDDHRPRTPGWDRAYLAALKSMGTGIVYGDDLLQGEAIPTQVAMTADIPRVLGHMAPPALTHLFVDNYWRDLGCGADCISYLPDVIVEHVHPFAGKSRLDEGYRRVNAPTMYAADSAAYAAYAATQLPDDIVKVRALCGR